MVVDNKLPAPPLTIRNFAMADKVSTAERGAARTSEDHTHHTHSTKVTHRQNIKVKPPQKIKIKKSAESRSSSREARANTRDANKKSKPGKVNIFLPATTPKYICKKFQMSTTKRKDDAKATARDQPKVSARGSARLADDKYSNENLSARANFSARSQQPQESSRTARTNASDVPPDTFRTTMSTSRVHTALAALAAEKQLLMQKLATIDAELDVKKTKKSLSNSRK